MSKHQNKWLHIFFIFMWAASLSACDKISIPRLSFDEKPETKIPIFIIYHFNIFIFFHVLIHPNKESETETHSETENIR